MDAVSISWEDGALAYRFALEELPALAPDVIAATQQISSRIGYREVTTR
jgi:hypothetical protein